MRRFFAALAWAAVGTALIVAVHFLAAGSFGLAGADDLGIAGAIMLYLPTVGVLTFLGGLLRAVFR